MKPVYSPLALHDLDQIWSDVGEASQDPEATDRYIRDLREAIRKKALFAGTGSPLMWNGEFTGIRFISFKAYLAFYREN